MFPTGWTRLATLTVPAAKVSADLTDFPVVVTRVCLPDAVVDPSGSAVVQADGGDLRITTDSAGTTLVPLDVVSFAHDSATDAGDAAIEFHFKAPSLSASVDNVFHLWGAATTTQSQPAVTDTYGRNAVWSSDYAAVYHMGLPNVVDSTGNGNNGTAEGSPASATGAMGSALDFDGVDDRILISDTASIRLQAFTIHALVKLDSVSSLPTIVWKGRDAGEAQSYFLRVSEGNLQGGIFSDSASFLTGSTALQTGQFYQLEASYDGAVLMLYVDGVVDGSGAASGTIAYDTNSLGIGAKPSSINLFPLSGLIDEVRLSSTARSANWIATEYANQNDPATFITTAGLEAPGAVSTALESISLSTNAATVNAANDIAAALESISLTANASSLALDKVIAAALESLSLTTHAGSAGLGSSIQAAQESVSLTSVAASIVADIGISAGIESLLLSTNSATVTASLIAEIMSRHMVDASDSRTMVDY